MKTENITIGATHGFSFKPKKSGFADFALKSKILHMPEENGFGMFAFVIAGLTERDFPRIQIREFSDIVMGTLYMATDENGEYNNENPTAKELNETALKTTHKFLDSAYAAGFSYAPIEIEPGDPLEKQRKKAFAKHNLRM